jgi:undecaprenyl-diphosphatase
MVGYSLLKILFRRLRPATDYAATLKGFSFPSGHASHALAIYGLLAYAAWVFLPQPWGKIVSGLLALLVLLIGVSRVYLGAHFPTDVLGAWIISGIVLLAIIRGLKL